MSVESPQPSNLIVSHQHEGIAVVELNRPRKKNALSQALINELTGTLHHLDRSPDILVVVLCSAFGTPFCGRQRSFSTSLSILTCNVAGADLSELAHMTTSEAHRTGWLKDLQDAFANFRKPVLAAVQGFAVCLPKEMSCKLTNNFSLAWWWF